MKYRDEWVKRNASVWRAFEKLYRDGRVKAIGISNFCERHIEELLRSAEIMPAVDQIELHPGLPRIAERKYLSKKGITVEAWAPFRIGEVFSEPVIVSLAEKYGVTPAQITLRWHLQSGIVPLPKSATPERIASNIDVYGFSLSDEDMALINGISEHELRHEPDTIDF